MLVETVVGDAYGAGLEYVSRKYVKEHNTLEGCCAHPRHSIKPGSYTDDTQMSIAVALAIVE